MNQTDVEADPRVGLPMNIVADMIMPSSAYYPSTPGCDGGSDRRVTNVVIQNKVAGIERLLLDRPALVESIGLRSK